ncbi:MAG: glycosyl hydrolase 115 family protein [Chitinophagaceae bacterium]
MKNLIAIIILLYSVVSGNAQDFVLQKNEPGSFPIVAENVTSAIYVDSTDDNTVVKAAFLLQQDIEMVTGKKIPVLHSLSPIVKNSIVVGTAGKSSFIQLLAKANKINLANIEGRWEAYQLQAVGNPFNNSGNALVIAGSDRRAVAYGVFELSKQAGVSPWYWWADVPVKKKKALYIKLPAVLKDEPKVKYRGIFINDEAPALSTWSLEKFGGFNSKFYAKVFELILRLKGNYIWPAMWGNAFYDDDTANIKTADEYGIVIGTSHHEPLMRAHDEWKRYGKGKWNYDSNEVRLKEFWRKGMKRATNEKIVSIGMRGDGDEPMSRETATALLERIVADQRQIITSVTGKPAEETPQLWALYKEVQDYYDKGMRVPDDVTLLLCDDNWGNIRRLPSLDDKPRKGGYGIYYHFDYVGGPRNYKWLNTNPLPRIWEQMHLAYAHNVKDIWIVNVGDIKPMEFPISFFLDYAWNPDKIDAANIQRYTQQWAAAQFGSLHANEIAAMLALYAKYNSRRKPELLNENTFSLENYGELERITADWQQLNAKAEKINKLLPAEYLDAYFQLILHPIKACSNLQSLYTAVAYNHWYAAKNNSKANAEAEKAKAFYVNDSLISLQYHTIANGKWNHMMSQTHIGYTYWQQPNVQKMPELQYVNTDAKAVEKSSVSSIPLKVAKPGAGHALNAFFEKDGYVSIQADHYSKAVNTKNIQWKVLPDLGRTGSAITVSPVTAATQNPGANTPQLQYEFYTYENAPVKLYVYFSPTLNINNDAGLQYAVSIDDEVPQIISINKEDDQPKIWGKWVADNIIVKATDHAINKAGKHILRYWMVSPAVVLQQLVLDMGGLKESYLGPPETK